MKGTVISKGSSGAFLVQGSAIEEPLGAFMIHPTVESAQERFGQALGDGDDEVGFTVFGYPGGWGHYSDGSTVLAVVDGFVIVSALAKGPTRGTDEPLATDFREADARVLAHLAGMLDHLRTVTANPE